jgi:hypothetical protein
MKAFSSDLATSNGGRGGGADRSIIIAPQSLSDADKPGNKNGCY